MEVTTEDRRSGRSTKIILQGLLDIVNNYEAILQDHEDNSKRDIEYQEYKYEKFKQKFIDAYNGVFKRTTFDVNYKIEKINNSTFKIIRTWG